MENQQITQLSILGVVSIVGLIAAIGLLSTPSTTTPMTGINGGGQQGTVVGQQGFWDSFGSSPSEDSTTDSEDPAADNEYRSRQNEGFGSGGVSESTQRESTRALEDEDLNTPSNALFSVGVVSEDIVEIIETQNRRSEGRTLDRYQQRLVREGIAGVEENLRRQEYIQENEQELLDCFATVETELGLKSGLELASQQSGFNLRQSSFDLDTSISDIDLSQDLDTEPGVQVSEGFRVEGLPRLNSNFEITIGSFYTDDIPNPDEVNRENIEATCGQSIIIQTSTTPRSFALKPADYGQNTRNENYGQNTMIEDSVQIGVGDESRENSFLTRSAGAFNIKVNFCREDTGAAGLSTTVCADDVVRYSSAALQTYDDLSWEEDFSGGLINTIKNVKGKVEENT